MIEADIRNLSKWLNEEQLAPIDRPALARVLGAFAQLYHQPSIKLKFKQGDRIQVKQTAGFHRGALGVVQYVAPDGKIWVRRDNASSDVFYFADELQPID